MPRPVSIHDDDILAAACRIFLTHGYQASTSQIARHAGVSEGSLFKRFRTKTALFLAAMDVQSREQEWQNRLLSGVGQTAIRPALEVYGRHLLHRLQIVMPRILMVTSSGVRFAKHYNPGQCPPPLQHVAILTRYLRAEVRAGRMRLAHPEIQADVFVGALSHCVFCEMVFGRRNASHTTYIHTLVNNILQQGVLKPPATKPAGHVRRRATPRLEQPSHRRGTLK
ncbi:MAG: TetR/AcrR family transcriptional regulator [Kiritimatiellia bacterium]